MSVPIQAPCIVQDSLNDLLTSLQSAQRVALFGHRNIDGDCMGACLTVGTILERKGKQVAYFTPTQPSSKFSFLGNLERFQTHFDYGEYDLLVFLDTANPQQLLNGFRVGNKAYFTGKKKIVIDHHISNTLYGDLNYVDSSSSSACEYLFELLIQIMPEQLDADLATYLFMGISTDTGHFLYPQDASRTFKAVSALCAYGARQQEVIQQLYRSNSHGEIQFLGTLLARIQTHDKVLASRYTAQELKDKGLDKAAVEGFLTIFTSIQHDGIFALFKTNPHDAQPAMRCSLRTNTSTHDVSYIASHFNGGGHRAAAGCKVAMRGSFEETMEWMVNKMNKLLTTSH